MGELGVAGDRDAALEHRRIVARVLPGEVEVGPPHRHERREPRRAAVVPGAVEPVGEHDEAAAGDLLDQLVAAAEVAVGRRGAHPRDPRRLGEGEAERPALLDQAERRPDQRLAQVAVVVALARGPVGPLGSDMSRPAMDEGSTPGPRRSQACPVGTASPRTAAYRNEAGVPMSDEIFADRMLSLGLARVSEAAAIAAAKLVGQGDEKAADQAAVDAMRTQLNLLDIKGTVVIGEGERDEAPMLYIGEEVGTGNGPGVDIALDPLEGTTLCAKDMPNALAVIAMGPRGSMLHAPDVYMDKLAIGPGYAGRRSLSPRHDPDRAHRGPRQGQGHRPRGRHGLRARAPAPRGAHRRDPRDRRPHPPDHRRRRRRRHPLRRDAPRPASTSTWAPAAPPRACSRRRR